MSGLSTARILRRKGHWLPAALALLWLLLFAFLAWPFLRANRANEVVIADMSDRIEQLGDWSGTAALRTEDAALWELRLAERYETLFPRQRGLQNLFYELARAASRSGIDPIAVRVLDEWENRLEIDPTPDMELAGDDPEGDVIQVLMYQLGISPEEFPDSEIERHALQICFESSYGELVRYLNELSAIPRALSMRKLDSKKGAKGVSTDMELEYYVQATR